MANEITSEVKGQSLIVTFNRPDCGNALNPDMAAQLFSLLKHVTTDRSVRAVLLRGQGGNFMDGIDMQLYAGDTNLGVERANQLVLPYHSAIRELQLMEKPVVAAVDGNVAGPGMSFMLACDFVLAARNTKFNSRFTSYALSPDGGASFFLTRKIGASKALELLMLNETFGTEKAEKLNLVNTVVDDDKLHVEALTWVERLAAGPTRAYGGVKMLVQRAFEQNLNTHLSLEHTYWGACSRTSDFKEAIKAMNAKRDPKYSGA